MNLAMFTGIVRIPIQFLTIASRNKHKMSCHTDTRKECQIIKSEERDKRIKFNSHTILQLCVWPFSVWHQCL